MTTARIVIPSGGEDVGLVRALAAREIGGWAVPLTDTGPIRGPLGAMPPAAGIGRAADGW